MKSILKSNFNHISKYPYLLLLPLSVQRRNKSLYRTILVQFGSNMMHLMSKVLSFFLTACPVQICSIQFNFTE